MVSALWRHCSFLRDISAKKNWGSIKLNISRSCPPPNFQKFAAQNHHQFRWFSLCWAGWCYDWTGSVVAAARSVHRPLLVPCNPGNFLDFHSSQRWHGVQAIDGRVVVCRYQRLMHNQAILQFPWERHWTFWERFERWCADSVMFGRNDLTKSRNRLACRSLIWFYLYSSWFCRVWLSSR